LYVAPAKNSAQEVEVILYVWFLRRRRYLLVLGNAAIRRSLLQQLLLLLVLREILLPFLLLPLVLLPQQIHSAPERVPEVLLEDLANAHGVRDGPGECDEVGGPGRRLLDAG
jgi:hypothetical protein